MIPDIAENTIYFETYEAREEAFRASVSALIPRKYSGPRLFWQDFGRASQGPGLEASSGPVAYITGNPRDCLVYGTAGQALAAARMCARGAGRPQGAGVASVARRFGLEAHLHQPVRTLSGGETVKVALAKAFIAAEYCRRLAVASPFTWLSQANRMYFHDLVARYRQAGLPVEVLALEGEDSTAALPMSAFPVGLQRGEIDFQIGFEGLKIRLTTSINPLYQTDRYADVEDFSTRLHSPCLLLGDNGQGKSLIARALAGALTCEGKCHIASRDARGPVRLLFQDVVGQTLLRNFEAIQSTAGRGNSRQFQEIYREIMAAVESMAPAARQPRAEERRRTFRSLLEMKAALLAVRLCGRPGALILDEPDWGVSRQAAVALVFSVIKAAHQRGVAVILISHKPWWLNAAGSVLEVRRSSGGFEATDPHAFTIRLRPVSRNIP